MLDNEELLFNELYEKTKDCGRTQFVRLLMGKDREVQKLNKVIYKTIEYIENDLKSFLYSIEYKTLLEILKGKENGSSSRNI